MRSHTRRARHSTALPLPDGEGAIDPRISVRERKTMAHGPPAGIGFRHPGMVLVIAIISLNVGKSEEAALAVAGHLGVFAGIEPPADGVGMDAQEWAEIPRPIMGVQ